MCIPSPQVSAAPASQIPSMQDANNIDLGGQNAPRGAANLGRLMLRLGGNPTGVAPVTPAAPSGLAPAATSGTSSTFASGSPSLGVTTGGSTGVPNLGLRLGASR